MKLKLRLQIGGRLLIANHLDESNYLPNRNSEKLIKYDLISLGCSLKLVLYSAPFTMRPSGPRPTVSVRFYTGACFLHQRSRAGVTKRNRRARTRDPPTHAPTQPTNQPTIAMALAELRKHPAKSSASYRRCGTSSYSSLPYYPFPP
jgi:hypothetical protein